MGVYKQKPKFPFGIHGQQHIKKAKSYSLRICDTRIVVTVPGLVTNNNSEYDDAEKS